MKKILMILILFTGIVACKDQPKKNMENSVPTEELEQVAEVHYACPMDCEEGKEYDAPGNCPVCKMKLVDTRKLENKQEHGHESQGEHQNH